MQKNTYILRCVAGLLLSVVILPLRADYTITVQSDGCSDPVVQTCRQGDKVTLTAEPQDDNVFVRWSDGNTTNPRTITVSASQTFTAYYKLRPWTIAVASNDGGSVSGAGSYDRNTSVTLTATPATNYRFLRWSDGNTSNPRTFTATRDALYTAVFESTVWHLTTTASKGGSVTGAGTYAKGSSATVIAQPAAGYSFYQWGDGNKTNPRVVKSTSDVALTATFLPHPFTVLLQTNECDVLSAQYRYGDQLTLQAAPIYYGSKFLRWSDGNTTNPRTVTISSDTTFKAVFSAAVDPEDPSQPYDPRFGMRYAVSINTSECDGALISNFYEGDLLTITAEPTATGSEFLRWSDGVQDNPRQVYISQDTTIYAIFGSGFDPFHPFNPGVYQVDATASPVEGGTIEGAGEHEEGSVVQLTAVANKNYAFVNWSDGETSATRSFTMTANDTAFTANFVLTALDTVIVTEEQNISDLLVGDITHVIVKETGKLTVDEPTEALSLTLYQTNTASAQVVNVSNLTVASADMVLRLEPTAEQATLAKWYAFGVPFEVEVASGIAKEGASSNAQSGYDFVIDNYDGALRATTQQGWKRCQSSDVLQQGKFYMLAVNGTQNLWRFTKKASAAITEQTSLTVNQNTATSANHSGWNGLSNSLLQSAMASMQGLTYATVYRNATSTYETILLAQSALDASHPFFVQVAKSGTILLSEATTNAPARMLAATTAEDNPIYTIAFKNESNADTYTDKAYLSLSETKSDEYIIGLDLEKMQANTTTVPQLWLEAYGMQLAAHETVMADNAITTIPVGLYAPADGEYTLTTMHDGECRMHNAQCVMFTLLNNGSKVSPTMTNSETNTTTWTLYLTKGNNSNYALQIGERGIGTSTISFPSGENQGEASKLIINGTLYIKRDGKTYTAQGGEVK